MVKQPVLLTFAEIQASLRPASENAMEQNGKALCKLLGLRDVSEITEVMQSFTIVAPKREPIEIAAKTARFMSLYLYALAHTEETGTNWAGVDAPEFSSVPSVEFVVHSDIVEAQRQLARDNFGDEVHADAVQTSGEKHGNYHIIASAEFFSVTLW